MGTDLPPDIDDGTNHLYCHRYYYDDADDTWRIAIFHPEETAEIAHDGDNVWHDTTLLLA